MIYSEKNGRDKDENKRHNIKDFFRGFFATIAVIVPAIIIINIMTLPRVPTADDGAIGVSDNQSEIPIKATVSYNLLWILSDSDTGNLLCTALVRFDVENYRVVVSNIPDNTVMLQSKTPIELSKIFGQRGATGVKAAVEETLCVPISGYVGIKSNDFIRVMDSFGEITLTLDKEVKLADEGLVNYSKPAGTSEFSGNDIVKTIAFGNFSEDELMRLHERMWTAFFTQIGDDAFADKLLSVYSSFVDNIETDINSPGIYALSVTADTVCAANGAQVEVVRPQGRFSDGRFELTQGADEHLWAYFSKL